MQRILRNDKAQTVEVGLKFHFENTVKTISSGTCKQVLQDNARIESLNLFLHYQNKIEP